MSDITYCINDDCPFEECARHPCRLQGKEGYVSIANFAGTCRDYIGWLIKEIKSGENQTI